MKKIYFTFLFAGLFLFSFAQNYTVILAVDMSNETVMNGEVSVAGNFQDDDANNPGQGEWSDGGAHTLSDPDGDDIYTIEIAVPAGEYQYKFINGLNWGGDEGSGLNDDCGIGDGYGNYNRVMTISSDTTLGYVFNSCTEIDLTTSTSDITTAATFQITPNPAADIAQILIENPENEALTMTLSNLLGQTVRSQYKVNTNVLEINTNELGAGIYLVTLQNEQGGQISKKLIVR